MFYTQNVETYVGVKPKCPYKLKYSTEKVVMKLVASILNSGRNIIVDNNYTSVGLAKHLLGKEGNIFLLSRQYIKRNKKELLNEFTCSNTE